MNFHIPLLFLAFFSSFLNGLAQATPHQAGDTFDIAITLDAAKLEGAGYASAYLKTADNEIYLYSTQDRIEDDQVIFPFSPPRCNGREGALPYLQRIDIPPQED